MLRVHLYHADAPGDGRLQIGVEPAWAVPAGIAARHEAGAYCSVAIPALCLGWKRIGIWINPLERQRLHDWVAERGAPGILMHLWLTVDSLTRPHEGAGR